MLKTAFESGNGCFAALVCHIVSGPIPSISGGYSRCVKGLCTDMLSRNPASRPSAQSAVSRINLPKNESKKTGYKLQSSLRSVFTKKGSKKKKKQKDDFRPVLLGALSPVMESNGDEYDQPPRRKAEGPRFAACPRDKVGRGPTAPVHRGAHGREVQGRLPAGTRCRYLSESAGGWVNATLLSYNERNGRCTLELVYQGRRSTKEDALLERVSPTINDPWPNDIFVTYHSRNDNKKHPAVIIDYYKGGFYYKLDVKDGADVDQIRLRM